MSSSVFETPRETLDWAQEAIQELHASCASFLKSDNFREVREYDPDTRQNVVKVVLVGKFPRAIARKTTEALTNVRHSFDQSIYAACRAIGKTPKDSIYFPWADSPTDLDYRLGAISPRPGKPAKIKIPPELWPILRKFEPYRRGERYAGGDDVIRALAQIANRKHTVNLNFIGMVGGLIQHSGKLSSDGVAGPVEMLMPHWDPVKNEIVLARAGHIEADYRYTLKLGVVLDEAPPLKGVSATGALREFVAKAQAVLKGLEAEAAILAPP